MTVKNFIRDYLSFGKKERLGLLFLLLLALVLYCLPFLFTRRAGNGDLKKGGLLALAIDTLEARKPVKPYESERAYDRYPPSTGRRVTGELFSFDPNTLDAEGWQRLGLREKTARTILKYRDKGGKFYRKEDLQKIWGLPPGFFERVKDYIVLEKRIAGPAMAPVYAEAQKKPAERIVIDVNAADSLAFQKLKGIGTKLAARITAFRDRLGGFYSVDQVAETYGLPDSVFRSIRPQLEISGETKQLSLNEATKEDLKSHPYFRWNLANAIVEYRGQHGSFKTLEELKNIPLIDEKTFEKIRHYLRLN